MNEPTTNGMDLIEELRLRRWARDNYVPETERPADLHPVILNEMQLRDQEQLQQQALTSLGDSVVPLLGTPQHGLHGPHFTDVTGATEQHNAGELHYF